MQSTKKIEQFKYSIFIMFFQSIIFIIFSVYFFHKTALHIAVENNNIEILRLLLQHPTIDVNSERIFNNFF